MAVRQGSKRLDLRTHGGALWLSRGDGGHRPTATIQPSSHAPLRAWLTGNVPPSALRQTLRWVLSRCAAPQLLAAKDRSGRTPLALAARAGHLEQVRLLVQECGRSVVEVSDPKLLPMLIDVVLQRWPATTLLESVDWKQARPPLAYPPTTYTQACPLAPSSPPPPLTPPGDQRGAAQRRQGGCEQPRGPRHLPAPSRASRL